ncbi:MAG TPA: hypothetical protein VJY34_03825 [Roseiarcus sp.]|nr:hypothetical protein [Roseiarcus sp.]
MPRHKFARSLFLVAPFAVAGYPCSAAATVMIKTFEFSICVTGTKHPDACKNAGADAHVVVSDDAMERLDGRIGQGASIMAVTGKDGSAPSRQDRHQHRRQIRTRNNLDCDWPGVLTDTR